MMMCETMAEQAKEIKKLKAELAVDKDLYDRLYKLKNHLEDGYKAELAEKKKLLEEVKIAITKARDNALIYENIFKTKVIELSRELNEASFLTHEQRYKASAMVDKLLSSEGKEVKP